MALDNVQYNFIIRTYEEKQDKNRHLLEKRRAYVYEHIDGYKELEDSIASISVEHGKKLLEGDKSALDDLKAIIKNFSESKVKLLVSSGFPSDYLEPVYDCPDCKDTGYIDGKKCHCFRQVEISMLYEQSHISKMLMHENFSNLSYEYYSGEDLLLFKDAVNTCKKFIENFDSVYQNLFFYGTVGSGKSFLSGCVAKELIEKGRSVLYFSSVVFFETLSQLSYGFKNKDSFREACDDFYECDLLIIDDLGAEVVNNYTSSQLFSCLNERHIRHKATVISTNLSLEELRIRYSDRIFSRITSNYTLCKLSGPDIRIYKKLNGSNQIPVE
ncbi:MAG: ATP-binding protein [Clostridiales bacterium]|nr:ATP-binding protein [Clostridiales bacterium]